MYSKLAVQESLSWNVFPVYNDYSEVAFGDKPQFSHPGLAITLCDRVGSNLDKVCKFDIIFRQAAAVMCAECNLYLVVHVEPFRVMVHFLGLQSNTCHESKCLVEIFEKEFLVNSVSAFHFSPPRFAQGRKSCVSFLFVEFLAFWWWHDENKTKKKYEGTSNKELTCGTDCARKRNK